ncbi:protein quiver-like isoform X2 [Paramacrobiotus metropolitanus]|uniref:protein quiver-like isoform X2 n=1 Tax=Paramacrobiotus metropolitanus TaxID=2943436 RepID=UPI002445C819|nr:protein quiver-like isoform X2 [Paramacrobiotus metropolitanus]
MRRPRWPYITRYIIILSVKTAIVFADERIYGGSSCRRKWSERIYCHLMAAEVMIPCMDVCHLLFSANTLNLSGNSALNVLCFAGFSMILLGSVPRTSSQSHCRETIGCYECKSTADRDCRDPFNSSLGLFPLEPCKGCCIKIIQHRSTEQESIWRTCTAKLDISHSLVHSDVCMDESNGRGQLCICSTDRCNTASPSTLRHESPLIYSLCALLFPTLLPVILFHRAPL